MTNPTHESGRGSACTAEARGSANASEPNKSGSSSSTLKGTQRTTSSLLLKNSAWNVLANLVSGAVAFLLVPFMLQRLGQQQYGVWILIGSAFAYSGVLGLGLSSAINRYIPVSLARGNEDDIRRVTSTGTVFFCGAGLVLGLLTIVLYWGLTRWFQIPAALADAGRATVLIVGGFACLSVVTQGFEAVLSGYQRYDLSGISRISMVLLRAALVAVVLLNGGRLLAVACVFGLTELGTKLMNYGFCLRLTPPRLVSVKAFDPGLLRQMLGYGINTFLYSAGTLLTYKASELVIGVFLRTEDVAVYSVAATAVLVLSTSIVSLCAAIKPAASDLDARGDADSVRELSIVSQKYTLFLIIPSAGFLVIMGREFLRVWTHLDTPQLSLILALLAVSQAIQLAQHSNFVVMVGKGEHRLFGVCVALIGVSTVGLGILNTGFFHWGLVGVAVANLFPLVVVCGFIIPIHVNSNLGLTWHEAGARVWKPVLFGCFPSLLFLLAWKRVHPPTTWAEIIAIVIFTGLLTAFMAWRWGLDQRERGRFAAFLERRLPFTRSAKH